MGGAVSAGENNAELVDNLVDADYIKTGIVEKVFRAVDRGDYYLLEHRESAYKDLAWKHGNIHLSAPCIYAEVLENLELGPGMSFLNLGSGTGYLNTMIGLIIGPYGVNHGVEYHADVIDYAQQHVHTYCKTVDSFDEFEFCPPYFTRGNCLLLASSCRLYDRLYCGAACPPEYENYMKNLIKVGGILVMPLSDQLLQIRRTSETTWESKSVLPVSFASLIMPVNSGPIDLIDLPSVNAMTLQDICRIAIRRILRRNIQIENPQLGCKRARSAKRRTPREKRHRINLVPMQAGLMVLGQFGGDSDSEVELGREFEREIGVLEDMRQTTRRRLHHLDHDEEEEQREEETERQEEMETAGLAVSTVQETYLHRLNNVEDDSDAGFDEEICQQADLLHHDESAHDNNFKIESNLNGNSMETVENEKQKVENGNKEEKAENTNCEDIKSGVNNEAGGINISVRQRKSSVDHISESVPGSNGFSSASYSSSGIGTCGSLEAEQIGDSFGVTSGDELSSSPVNHRSSDESLHADDNDRMKIFPNVNDEDDDDEDDDDMHGMRRDYFRPGGSRRGGSRVTWRRPAANEPASPNIDDVLDFGRMIATRLNQTRTSSGEVKSDAVMGAGETHDDMTSTHEKAKSHSGDGERSSEVTYRCCMKAKVEMLTLPQCLKQFVLFDRN